MIRIPEPCHEDWNKMTPAEKGRFCQSCQKVVVDFREKSQTEIKQILISKQSQGEKTCGRFNRSQLDMPAAIKERNAKRIPMRWLSHFAAACVLVFGSSLFTGCTEARGDQMDIHHIQMLSAVDSAQSTVNDSSDLVLEDSTVIQPKSCKIPVKELMGDIAIDPEPIQPKIYDDQPINGGAIFIPEEDLEEIEKDDEQEVAPIVGLIDMDFEAPPKPDEVQGNIKMD